jgi:hypothetical protein
LLRLYRGRQLEAPARIALSSIVDLDDANTWPTRFGALVEQAAVGADEDTWFDISDEAAVEDALTGCRVRAYHCTRLTPREVEDIRFGGLRPLSPEFTLARLTHAVEDGHLTDQEAALYGNTTLPKARNRAGRVWLFTDRASLASAPQIGYLVEVWGGEGINMVLGSRSVEMDRLERVGTPSVVVAAIDLDVHCQRAHPGILTAAVRQLLSKDGGTLIECGVKVGPEYIEAIEHPGGSFWDRYVWTPKEGFKAG